MSKYLTGVYSDKERANARRYYHELSPEEKQIKLNKQREYRKKSPKYKEMHERIKASAKYKEYQLAYRKSHPETPESLKRHFKNHLNNHYKMTVEEYNNLLLSQNNKCAICLGENRKNKFSVDHNHDCCKDKKSCGKCNRGLLCIKCNLLLGASRDSISILKAAIGYLEKWKL